MGEVKNKGGRPRKIIPKDEFEKLCGLQCTLEEMCCFFNCDENTLESWCKRTYHKGFSEIFRRKRGSGRVSLRRKQYQVAMSGNPTMLIWLGRNWLDQTDKQGENSETATLDKLDSILTEMKNNAKTKSETE